LQEQSAFPNSRFSAKQNHRPGNQTTPQNEIQLIVR